MEPGNSQQRESAPPGDQSSGNSFTRFIKEAFSRNKGSKSSSSATSTHGGRVIASPRVYVRPHRRFDLTEEDLKTHVTALQVALEDAWPRRHHSRYRNARALLVCWSESDSPPASSETANPLPLLPLFGRSRMSPRNNSSFPVRTSSAVHSHVRSSSSTSGRNVKQDPFPPAAYQLAGVLEKRYGIQSQVWMIPTLDNPQIELTAKINTFVDEYGRRDNLLIFWYGGNADFLSTPPTVSPAGGNNNWGELVWYGKRDGPGIKARAVTKALGLSRADVLMLNDSPFPQHAYSSRIEGPVSFELLGPDARENPHAASFTLGLAQMLDAQSLAAHGVSVPELHRMLLDVTAPGNPTRVPAAPGRNPVYPVYMQIAQLFREARRDIVLSRLDASLAVPAKYGRDADGPGVTVQVRLPRYSLDVRRWREWLLIAPDEAEAVSVQVSGKT